jgi:hypothetical protein
MANLLVAVVHVTLVVSSRLLITWLAARQEYWEAPGLGWAAYNRIQIRTITRQQRCTRVRIEGWCSTCRVESTVIVVLAISFKQQHHLRISGS